MKHRNSCASVLLWSLAFCISAKAIAPPSGPTAVIAQYDFSDAADGSTLPLARQAGTWSISGGKLNSSAGTISDIAVITEYDPLDERIGTPSPTLDRSEFTYHARIQNLWSARGNVAGVVYNYQDRSNYYEVVFNSTGTAQLRTVRNGMFTIVATASYLQGGKGVWFVVEVTRRGNELTTIHVNGLPVFNDVPQRELPDGRVGLITHWSKARFNRLSVTTPVGVQPFVERFTTATTQFSPRSGQWSVSSGTYGTSSVVQTAVSTAADVRFTDLSPASYSFRARLYNPYGASGNVVGLVWNYFDASNYGELVFSPAGTAKLNEVINGQRTTLASARHAIKSRTWFHVKLVRGVYDITVYLNGQFLLAYHNVDLFLDYGIGLLTHWSPGRFDDVDFDLTVMHPYAQTFDGSIPANWTTTGEWMSDGSSLVSSGLGAHDIASSYPFGPFWDQDIIYRARLLNEAQAADGLAGLVFNQGGTEGYELLFSPSGIAYLFRSIEGTRVQVATAQYTSLPNSWIPVEIIRRGVLTTVKANGVTLFNDIPLGQLGGGAFGFITRAAIARFDDLYITEYPLR
jgi:hypothetical protein